MRYLLLILLLFVVFFIPAKVFAADANLKCSPASGTYAVGDKFIVDFLLDTRDMDALGASVVATYDPSILEVTLSTSTAVTTDTNWGQPVTNTVDNVLGKIEMDYGSAQPSFSGQATIGQIAFITKTGGQAQLNFTFFQSLDDTTPGVAKVWGKKDGINLSNILSDVNNCIYVVNADSSVTPLPTAAPDTPTSTPIITSPPVSELPRAGDSEMVLSLMGLSAIFVSIGIVIPAIKRSR